MSHNLILSFKHGAFFCPVRDLENEALTITRLQEEILIAFAGQRVGSYLKIIEIGCKADGILTDKRWSMVKDGHTCIVQWQSRFAYEGSTGSDGKNTEKKKRP